MTEIGLLTQEARLALAVRAQVASIRADQADERAALLRKQMAPFDEAAGRFERLYGHEPDLQDAADAARMLPLLTGTADVSQKTVLAAVEAGGRGLGARGRCCDRDAGASCSPDRRAGRHGARVDRRGWRDLRAGAPGGTDGRRLRSSRQREDPRPDHPHRAAVRPEWIEHSGRGSGGARPPC